MSSRVEKGEGRRRGQEGKWRGKRGIMNGNFKKKQSGKAFECCKWSLMGGSGGKAETRRPIKQQTVKTLTRL